MSIDPDSGEFSWTPSSDQAAGKYDVTVSVQGPDGQTAQTTFAVTVTRPIPAPATLSGKEAVELGDGVKLELVLIPAGEFLMGSPDLDKNAQNIEKPQHQVRITKPFYLGAYPVTQEQWKAVMGNNPSRLKGPKNPVEQVSWDDCQEFLKRLNERFRRSHPSPLLVGEREFRLPTEAQWEYACRAGSTTRYCFGNAEKQLGKYAWYGKNSGDKTHPVGEKKPNAWGLYDMHGNVSEWCADWFGGDYTHSRTDDPTGPTMAVDEQGITKGVPRMIRGGNYRSLPKFCRSASRISNVPDFSYYDLGFRVARMAE
jgi:formylglycine-generating enzyme required for sulfatase activity